MGKREKQRARKLKKSRVQRKETNVKRPRAALTGLKERRITPTYTSPSGAQKRKRSTVEKPNSSVNFLYKTTQAILVVGDGDFSFSRALLRRLAEERKVGGGRVELCVLCTSLDSKTKVLEKYKGAAECLQEIEKLGGRVRHAVDGTKLEKTLNRGNEKFDRIIFNFPHSGQQRVHINRTLLRDFFVSAQRLLQPLGQIHVALKIKPPYSNWKIEEQARESGLVVLSCLPFYLDHFPGYRHRTTDPLAQKFEAEFCRTFVFVRPSSHNIDSGAKKEEPTQEIEDGQPNDATSEGGDVNRSQQERDKNVEVATNEPRSLQATVDIKRQRIVEATSPVTVGEDVSSDTQDRQKEACKTKRKKKRRRSMKAEATSSSLAAPPTGKNKPSTLLEKDEQKKEHVDNKETMSRLKDYNDSRSPAPEKSKSKAELSKQPKRRRGKKKGL